MRKVHSCSLKIMFYSAIHKAGTVYRHFLLEQKNRKNACPGSDSPCFLRNWRLRLSIPQWMASCIWTATFFSINYSWKPFTEPCINLFAQHCTHYTQNHCRVLYQALYLLSGTVTLSVHMISQLTQNSECN